jgi:hypothetical protein
VLRGCCALITNNDWITYQAAISAIVDQGFLPTQFASAWLDSRLHRVRLRGRRADDPKSEPIEIPIKHLAQSTFELPDLLVPHKNTKSAPLPLQEVDEPNPGYVSVRFSHSNIVRLWEEDRTIQAQQASRLATSYFAKPRWGLEPTLGWIAFRRIEGLLVSHAQLSLERREESRVGDRADALLCPVDELLTALEADKLRSIDAEHKELPPEFWDNRPFDPKKWPDVRFRRVDVLRLWPSLQEKPPRAGSPSEEASHFPTQPMGLTPDVGAAEPASKIRKSPMSGKDIEQKLPSFLKQLLADWNHLERFNQITARKAAEAHFRKNIHRGQFRAIYVKEGLKQDGGRPRETPQKS